MPSFVGVDLREVGGRPLACVALRLAAEQPTK
jgi:hypothetical protein